MADVTVRPVLTGGDRRVFINFPYRLYREHDHWVAPLRVEQKQRLNADKNPFFEHSRVQLFLAEDSGGHVVGRIAAIVNGMHLETYHDDTGFFGFFETIEDPRVADALLDRAAEWLKQQGLSAMRGPTNPSLTDTAGLLVDGYDRRPALLMPYNFPYYETFLQQYGMERVMTMWAYYVHQKYFQPRLLERGTRLVRGQYPEITTRLVEMDRLKEEAETIRTIYNDAWSNNWGHVPVTSAEFQHLADDMRQLIHPELVVLLEVAGEPVAFTITLPDLNEVLQHVPDGRLFPSGLPKLVLYTSLFQIRTCRMALMGVRKTYQGQGLSSLLVLEAIHRLLDYGYRDCEMSWVLDSNEPMKKMLDAIGGVKDKEYGMFEISFNRLNVGTSNV